MSAVNIEALAPAVRDGTVVASAPDCAGLALVRDGRIAGAYAGDSVGRTRDEAALRRMQHWPDAVVSAQRLDASVAEMIPTLLAGVPCYDDLRLDWVDWARFVEDLRARAGTFVLEVRTPRGSGVGVLREGMEPAAYTETAAGSFAVLDELVADKRGTLRVRVAVAQAAESLDSAMMDMFGPAHPVLDAAAMGRQQLTRLETGALAQLAPELKSIARARLRRSADRVERLIDAATARGDTLSSLVHRIRETRIRGVVPASMESLADAMQNLSRSQSRDQRFLPA
jgi:hypothetical protein